VGSSLGVYFVEVCIHPGSENGDQGIHQKLQKSPVDNDSSRRGNNYLWLRGEPLCRITVKGIYKECVPSFGSVSASLNTLVAVGRVFISEPILPAIFRAADSAS